MAEHFMEDESEEFEDTEPAEQEEQQEQDPAELLKAWQKEHRTEIKYILLGNLTQLEDGKYAVSGKSWITRVGLADGAQEALIFGITERWVPYETKYRNHTQAVYQAGKVMSRIGKPLVIQTVPEGAAVYVKGLIFRPVVLLFEDRSISEDERQLVLHAYCGRSLLAGWAIRRAINRFNRELPRQLFPKGAEPGSGKPKAKEHNKGGRGSD